MDQHRLNNSHSLCENSENNKVERSCDTQMTVALRTEHLSQNTYSSVPFVLALQCISFSLDRLPSRPLSSSSGYTSSNQALMPWVKVGQCLASSLWKADTVSKLNGPLLNYSTPEEKKKIKWSYNKTASSLRCWTVKSSSQNPIRHLIHLVSKFLFQHDLTEHITVWQTIRVIKETGGL